MVTAAKVKIYLQKTFRFNYTRRRAAAFFNVGRCVCSVSAFCCSAHLILMSLIFMKNANNFPRRKTSSSARESHFGGFRLIAAARETNKPSSGGVGGERNVQSVEKVTKKRTAC